MPFNFLFFSERSMHAKYYPWSEGTSKGLIPKCADIFGSSLFLPGYKLYSIHVASLPACMSWSYQCADDIMPFSACYTEYYTKCDNLSFSDYVACRKDQGAWGEVRIKCPYFREYYIIIIMIVTKTECRKSSQDVERVWRLQRVETQSRRFPTELWASAQHHT